MALCAGRCVPEATATSSFRHEGSCAASGGGAAPLILVQCSSHRDPLQALEVAESFVSRHHEDCSCSGHGGVRGSPHLGRR